MSSVGKGLAASSMGVLLKSMGCEVKIIKIDPYLNVDAGTMSPFEHGEVFVLDDGTEADLDLGNYERFLDSSCTGKQSITSGKVYQEVLTKEREGKYLGKTVQIVPHLTDEIQSQITKASSDAKGSVNIIELGGTVGDIESEPFLYALKEMRNKLGKYIRFVLISHIPVVKSEGESEQKTKPTQHCVQLLSMKGITPDMIICRCEEPVKQEILSKVSETCHVPRVYSGHNVSSIYSVPELFFSQGMGGTLGYFSNLDNDNGRGDITNYFVPELHPLEEWKSRIKDLVRCTDCESLETFKVAIIGKYTKKMDTYHSVIKAIYHSFSSLQKRVKVSIKEILEEGDVFDGIIIPGGFGDRGIENKISSIYTAVDKKIPVFGICLGLQLITIAAMRRSGYDKANSTEFDLGTPHPVIDVMPNYTGAEEKGGTMRKGIAEINVFHFLRNFYDADTVHERHRHRYEVNYELFGYRLENIGLKIIANSSVNNETNFRVEGIQWNCGSICFGVQYHPEFLSRPGKPSPVFAAFASAVTKKLTTWD